MSDENPEQTWVYRLVCAHGCLLYVGVAKDADRRLKQHASTKAWWPEVRVVLTDLYATRLQALKVEAYYITYFRPKHNVAGQIELPGLPHPLLQQRDMAHVDGRLHEVVPTVEV